MMDSRIRSRELVLATAAFAGITFGAVAFLWWSKEAASIFWGSAAAMAVTHSTWTLLKPSQWKRASVDVIALAAMAAALILGQYLAGAVVALMLTGGQALESYASTRAARDLSGLIERAPHTVHRLEKGVLIDRSVDQVVTGDLLLVKPGEVVPVDGIVTAAATLDESALTGESRLIEIHPGQHVRSGTLNSGSPFDLRATATAAESTYAGIVRLVRQAQEAKAPLVRLADQYAKLFLPVTLLASVLAWLLSGDPIRVLAVLVVATPCPLLLAAPVAMISGVSRAARRGIIMKGGGALETLGRVRTLLLDKTGTLTVSSPELSDIEAFGSGEPNEILRLAASVGQASPHVLSAAIVGAAQERHLSLSFPAAFHEQPGVGVRGTVEGRTVAIGSGNWVAETGQAQAAVRKVRRRTALEGSSHVFVAIDGVMAGALILDSPIRPETPRTIRSLRRNGIEKVVVLTGDHQDLAEAVAAAIGADQALGERSPADKVEVVQVEAARAPTAMVGDGINDAPALAAATVGIAMGARGATASSQAADIVLMVDRLDRLVDAVQIARRTRVIALQSIVAGMCLSVAGMILAIFGWITPLAGALIQEAIDVAVILNALRALRGDRPEMTLDSQAVEDRDRVVADHRVLYPKIKRLRAAADSLELLAPDKVREQLEEIRSFLIEELLPHERREDKAMYPLVARLIGGDDATETMSRAHLEIIHLTGLFARLLEDLPATGSLPVEDLRDFRRVLYGLDALLRLHFAQEDEQYLTLIDSHIEGGNASAGIPARSR